MIHFIAFLSGIVLSPLFAYFPCTVVLLSLAAAFYFFRKGSRAAAAVLALGLVYPAFGGGAPAEGLPSIKSGNITASGYFSSPAVKLRKGFAQEFRLEDGGAIEVHSDREFEIGREHELSLRVITPYDRYNPGELPSGQYAMLAYVKSEGGLHASVPVFFNRVRDGLNKAIAGRFDPERASLVMAVVTGHGAGMSYALKESFRVSGVAHLLSISGTHFGLMFLLLFGAFRLALRRLPVGLLERLTVYLTPSQAAALLCLPFLLFYLGISGMRVPTVRSFIMISLFLFGLLMGRKGRWLNFLVLAAVVLVLWDPGAIWSVSFQLSFLAVMFIGFFLTAGARAEDDGLGGESPAKSGRWRSVLKWPLTSVAITLSATLGVEPIVAYYFHYSSLVSPLANMVVTPLVCMVLVPLSVAGSFLYLLTGSFLLEPLVDLAARASIGLVGAFASVPHSSVPVPAFPAAVPVFYYAGFFLYFATRRKRFLAVPALSILIPAALFLSSERALAVTFLDAGRGDASVVELPDGKVMVVDTGTRGREAGRHLRRKGFQKIDYLVLTHKDYYHTGGASLLARQFKVAEVWDNGRFPYPDDFPEGPVRRSVKRGDRVEGEGYVISVLNPREGFRGQENDASLVLRVKGRGISVLFIGDIGAKAMKELASMGEELKCDAIRLSDHGRFGENHGAFLRAAAPSLTVLRGRPDGRTESCLEGIEAMYSSEEGAVRVTERKGGLDVRTYADDVKLIETRSPLEEARNIGKLFSVW